LKPITTGLSIGTIAVIYLFLLLQITSAQGKRPATSSQPVPLDVTRPFTRTIEQGGLRVDLQIKHKGQKRHQTGQFREGDNVELSLEIKDSATRNPLSGLNPAAWMTLFQKGERTDPKGCVERVQTLLGGGLFTRAELDLNVYHVLALNADRTITVVDPLFGYGSTKLLALIQLKSPGEDWVRTSDGRIVFVSMPESNEVAVIDTNSWSVVLNLEVGDGPTRVALQPDEGYLWISSGTNEEAGVAVVSLQEMKTVARVRTGQGPHEMAFSDDNRFAFVANQEAGTVSIIDIRRLIKIRDVPIGSKPASIAFSSLAQTVYVTSGAGGTITAISSPKHEVIARIKADAGLGQIRFAPGDRLGFVLNTAANRVYILDAAVNRIVQNAILEKAPDQLTFSSRLAYIRHRESEIVLMIPLNEVGKEGQPLPIIDFPGGQNPLGRTSRPSLAASIVPAGEDNAVLVANPADKTIYYYKEGMAAPMGNFSNYGREPRAVLIVDRSLRETKPGNYLSVARLPQVGPYRIVILIDSPRVVDCIEFNVAANPDYSRSIPPRIEVSSPAIVKSGKQIRLSFRIIDSQTGKPIAGLKDLIALTFAVGIWQDRGVVEHVGDGVYSLTLIPPKPAVYSVYLSSASIGLPHTQVSTFEAKSEK
jgi:YVTN family beta-propeller protein